jgi:PPP family 3-phenylpropionic acid transporter
LGLRIQPQSPSLFLVLVVFLTTRRRKKIYRTNFEPVKFNDLFKNKPLFIFFILIILYGITCAPVNSFLNLYFTELSKRNDLVGYAYAIMAFSELPLFIVGNILVHKLGAQKVILIAMLTMIIRFILYGLFPEINLALAVGLLQGISLPFFLVGAIDYLHKIMPSGQYAKIQSFMWGGYFGIGQMTGNLIIGYMIDQSGMIQVMKIFIGISIICFLATYIYFTKKEPIN